MSAQTHPAQPVPAWSPPGLAPEHATHQITARRSADGSVTAVVDGRTVATLPLSDAWRLAHQIEHQVVVAIEEQRPVDDAERRPFAGACPPFCHGRHHQFTDAIDDYHHQPLGSVGVSHDPLHIDVDEQPDAVQVTLIQHVTRDRQAYVGLDDDSQCLRFTADQARTLAARLLQGADILDAERADTA